MVLNRTKGKGYELQKHDVEGCMELPVLSSISEDDKIHESIAARMPVILYTPNSPAAKAFKKLSASILGEEAIVEGRSMLGTIKKFFMRR